MSDKDRWGAAMISQLLSTGNRPLRLRLMTENGANSELLLPQRVIGHETLCGSIEYRIICLADDATLALKQFIAAPAELQLVTDRGALHTVSGIVAEAHAGPGDGGLSTYQLVLRDALSLLEQRINTRIFRQCHELQIIDTLISEWRQSNGVLAATFDLEIDALLSNRHLPSREFVMQCNESDAGFIRRLLRRRGIGWYIRPRSAQTDAGANPTPGHVLALFDDNARLAPSTAGVIRYHRDHATEARDAITGWYAVRRLSAGSVGRFSWDYKRPKSTAFMHTHSSALADQGSYGNRFAAMLVDYQVQVPHIGDNHDDLQRLGELGIARHDFDSKCFHGESAVRDLRVGQWFTLADHPEIDRHRPAQRQFVVTSLDLDVSNNLPGQLALRVEQLLARCDWQLGQAQLRESASPGSPSTRYRNRFTCVRKDVPIVPAYDAQRDVPLARAQSAIVVGPDNEEVHCDELGRVKVRFPGTRALDHRHAQGAGASDTETDSAWIRVASSLAGAGPAGKQCGTVSLPRIGTEVLIDFLAGDPDRPLIVGQLFNGVGTPPELGASGGLPGNRYLSGMRSKEIGAGRASQLRFDDTAGQISAQLASVLRLTEN